MARGGARPGAGRPRKNPLPEGPKIPKPRGGARPGAGRKKKVPAAAPAPAEVVAFAPTGVKTPDAPKEWPFGAVAPEPAPPPAEPSEPAKPAAQPDLTPLDYLLSVVRDTGEDTKVRIQAASIAAPFVHIKKGEAGKKDEAAEKAKKAGAGKFAAAAAPPRLVHSR